MKLSDQEQTILRAIERVGSNGIAEISKVVKAVGYPKAVTKRTITRLAEKGLVAIHRHDWSRSLTPAQRKLMVRIGRDYFNAVSMKKRNPTKSKGKSALKKTGRALKGFAKGALSAGSEILGAGAMALNPVRRKIRNKYVDLVIRGQAKKTPDGWRVGKKTFAQGRGTVSVSSGYYLDRSTGMVYAKRQRNKSKKKRNADHKDSDHPIEVTRHFRAGPPGYLTPWQRAHHAGQSQLFDTGIKPAKKRNASKKSKGKKNASRSVHPRKKTGRTGAVAKTRNGARRGSVAETRKTATKANPTRKGMRKGYREAKRISKITKGRYFSSELGQRKAARHEKRLERKSRGNPSAKSIRQKFAGSVNGSRDLYFPQGTPSGQLAKLGKLVLIETEKGIIKPVHGTAWLCADTKERLHIGSTTNAPLFEGPARSFGKVTKVEYESSKPHLGYKGPIIWFHHMGERGGTKPTLHADGKGGLKFRGGRYTLTTRGIEH